MTPLGPDNHHWIETIPFLLMASDGKIKVNSGRIIEAVIIAVITALVSSYVMVQKMEVRLDYIERHVVDVRQDLKDHIIWDVQGAK